MKKISIILITGALFSISFIRPNINVKLEKNEMEVGDTLNFNHGPQTGIELFEASYKRGSYDGKKYDIRIDTVGNLIISNLRNSFGESSSEINIINGRGSITRKGDTLVVKSKTIYNTFYLINIKNGVIDSVTNELEMQLVSKNIKNEYCPNRVTAYSHVNIIALPKGVKYKEFYKPIHSDKTIGIFTYFSILDSRGNRKHYPKGDYILIGGNSQTVLK